VNHQRRAAIRKQRIRLAAHRHVLVRDRRLGVALGVDGEVHHVAGVRALGVLHAVLLVHRVEVAARAGEWRFALRHRVEVQRVFARRQAVHIKIDRDAAALDRRDHRHAHGITLGVLQINMLHLRRHSGGSDQQSQREY
jgi:hypothetical protein